ncbi:hypothetical protein JQ506_03475 [Shinella sp. PSBB067]|uniref:hypothetical protein n=2 Tax=unclassified Shinella TaxID=2643062 RepID=UPI00193C0130|nr:hypothetical protein [Shinella sp. PSBB067]MBN9053985.1 hypothetical protein [Hyphomicrobiales bacterium]QRI64087.1 hypothetical protein JQ506_03475 [Shinella sp. PSBB067]
MIWHEGNMSPKATAIDDSRLELWACDKAQEIMLREGFRLIRSARSGSNTEIRETSLMMARAIAASLVEASAARGLSAGE